MYTGLCETIKFSYEKSRNAIHRFAAYVVPLREVFNDVVSVLPSSGSSPPPKVGFQDEHTHTHTHTRK